MVGSGILKFMTEPVLTSAITAGALFVLIIGKMVGSFVPFVRQIMRAIQQSETRQIEAMKQIEARLKEAIEDVKARQMIINRQLNDLGDKVYALNGQVQGLVGHALGTEVVMMQKDIQALPPSVSI